MKATQRGDKLIFKKKTDEKPVKKETPKVIPMMNEDMEEPEETKSFTYCPHCGEKL